MERWVSRLAASAALIAILACSGLGLCWRQITCEAHDCCADKGVLKTSSEKACSSVVVSPALVKVFPAAIHAAPTTPDRLVSVLGPIAHHDHPSALRPPAAPLVLRL
jgi:hypothetical protein